MIENLLMDADKRNAGFHQSSRHEQARADEIATVGFTDCSRFQIQVKGVARATRCQQQKGSPLSVTH